jgi:branched-chain amino acid transport system substrate-binding protein
MLLRVIVSSALLLAVAAPAGAQPEPYRVGMSAAITGRASGTYAPTYEGFKAYFKRVNDAGGINGHPVALEVEDDRGEPQRAAAAAKKLAETSIVIVNASTSATYKPFMTEAETRKLPLLFGGGVCPNEAFPPANKLVFCSTSFGTKYDSRFALNFIKGQAAGKKVKVGFAAQDIPLSRIELEFAEQYAKEIGLDAIPMVVVPSTATDFGPFGQKLKDAGADWVLSWALWHVELGVFEAMQRLGYTGNYILYAHQQAQDDLTRLKAPSLHAFGGNSLFIENLPIHAEIVKAVQGQTQNPPHFMAEGWVSAMALEAGLRGCGWPCTPEKLTGALSKVSIDPRGLRGAPIEWTADNHYRKTTAYKVYRWDPARNAITAVGDWTRMDVK